MLPDSATANKDGIPPRPSPLPVQPDAIPAELRAVPHWVIWRYEWKPPKGNAKGKWDKPPSDAKTGLAASSTDPATWSSFNGALAARLRGGWDGLGFVLCKPLAAREGEPEEDRAKRLRLEGHEDCFVGLDLDHCRDPRTGAVEPWAQAHIDTLDTYAEVSPSGTGIRAIAKGRKPAGRCRKGPFEMYETGRYVTITGIRLPGTPAAVNDRQGAIDRVHAKEFPPGGPKPKGTRQGGAVSAALGDEQLIEKAKAAANGDKFKRLWDGDAGGYASPSEADAALCGMLAFWTGGDRERIDRLFRQSDLCREDKWGREDYRRRTIDLVLNGRTEFYDPRRPPGRPKAAGGGPQAPAATGGGGEAGDGYTVILDHFVRTYQPTFRRGTAMYSGSLGRLVKASEACFGAGIDLINRLALASDAPKHKNDVDRDRLPYFFNNWSRSAWHDLLATLPEEEDAGEISGAAREDFRALVSAALHTIVPMGYQHRRGREEVTEVQRRSLIDWCDAWAKAGPWQQVRSYNLWIRRDPPPRPEQPGQLHVALRAHLFRAGQVPVAELGRLSQNKFNRLAALYDVGTGEKDFKAGGSRATELTAEYIAEQRGAAAVAEKTISQPSRAHACEDSGKTATGGDNA